MPYDAILKEPGCVVAHGLPEGVGLKKPCEYDTRTLMKILEQSHRIQFSINRRVGRRRRQGAAAGEGPDGGSLPVSRPLDDPREKSGSDLNHNVVAAAPTPGGHAAATPGVHATAVPGGHAPAKAAPLSGPAPSSSSVLSSFLYGMPMSSKPHPDGKLDFKAMSFLSLGKERAGGWSDKMSAKDGGGGELRLDEPPPRGPPGATGNHVLPVSEESRAGEHGQSPPGVHISKRLLFSIVHEKSGERRRFLLGISPESSEPRGPGGSWKSSFHRFL